MLGGHFNANASKQEKVLRLELTPQLGVFVKDNLAVGGNLDFEMSRYGTTNKHLSLGIFPSGRYFFGRQNVVRSFLQIEAGYHRVNISVADLFIARSGLGGGVGAGIAFFLNETVSLEGMYKLRGLKYTDQSSALQSRLSMGIQLYIPSRGIKQGHY